MAMKKSVARSIIVVGVIELVVTSIVVVVGGIFQNEFSNTRASSVWLWSLCYGIPGIFSYAAGRNKSKSIMAVALVFNIIVTIVCAVGFRYLVISCIDTKNYLESECRHTEFYDEYIATETLCSTFKKIFTIIVVVTIIDFILMATSFIGCILGCMGTCCAPQDPVVITTIPAQQSTLVVNTQTSTQFSPFTYHPMVHQNAAGSAVQGYVGPPAPTYGVKATSATSADDDVPLLENIV